MNLLLHPMGRAAWVGLFATALNLLPAGQLDGGHILYTLTSGRHRLISLCVALALVPMAFLWMGWALWAALLLVIGFRHPPLIDRWEPLDRRRVSLRAWRWRFSFCASCPRRLWFEGLALNGYRRPREGSPDRRPVKWRDREYPFRRKMRDTPREHH